MAFSAADICNRASVILSVDSIISLDQKNPVARIYASIFDLERDMLLSEYNWGFATQFHRLKLLDEEPASNWAYAYKVPSDVLRIQAIFGEDSYTPEGLPFTLVNDGMIYTDVQHAVARATMRIDNNGLFPPWFIDLFSARLAVMASGALRVGSDRIEMANLAYRQAADAAMIADASQEVRKKDRIPLLDARRGLSVEDSGLVQDWGY